MTSFKLVSSSLFLNMILVCHVTAWKEERVWVCEGKQNPKQGPSCDGALFISSLAPKGLAQQCQWARSGSHISCALSFSLSHTPRTLFYLSGCCLLFVWLGSPLACLPAHHINPIMLHCSGCSSSGQLPSGKRGGREEEEREGESEEKRKVTRGHREAGTMKSECGLQDSEQGWLCTVRHATRLHPQSQSFGTRLFPQRPLK